jgi:hypothetical protein
MIGFIGTSLQLQSIITANTLNSFWTTSLWRISHESPTDLYYSRIHEWTPFYICHAARIEITPSKASITVLRECFVSETVC